MLSVSPVIDSHNNILLKVNSDKDFDLLSSLIYLNTDDKSSVQV